MKNCLQIVFKFLYFSLPCLLFTIQQAGAMPASPYPVEYPLPDGSVITITLKGDEHIDWAVSPDGYTLLVNPSGFYEYAQKNTAGDLILSGVRVHNEDKRTLNETSFLKTLPQNLRYSPEQLNTLREVQNLQTELRKSAAEGALRISAKGEVHAPLILVDFPGKRFVRTKADFELLMNQPNYTAGGTIPGSVSDYFYSNSFGQLQFSVDVYGPYTLSHEIAYYDYKNTPPGDAKAMAREAAELASADGCDFSNYDRDNDGYVDNIHIIYAGYGQEGGAPKGQSIWAHASNITANVTLNGKRVRRYSCSSELRGTSGTNITYIGVIAHELGHIFGLPDLYDTDDESSGGETVNPAAWDIMAHGSWNDHGRTPANYSAWSKVFVGWTSSISLYSPANILLPNPSEENVVYRMDTPTENEYFLMENRQRAGWDAYVPASGLLIYHVDENYAGWNTNKVNVNPTHRGYYVKQAGGGVNSDKSSQTTDPYPSGNNTAFTDTSVPNAKSWAGQNTGKPLTNITHNTGDGTVSFAFMGGVSGQVLVSTLVNPSNAGTVKGGAYYTPGNPVTVTASPADGYRFLQWKNGNTVLSTDNPYSLTVAESTTLTADFVPVETLQNLLVEFFETGAPGWTFVNGSQTNRWVTGNAIVGSGSQSAYISNNQGVSYDYTVTAPSVVHLYHDITFPALDEGQFQLNFDWKCRGEYTSSGSVSDYMEVRWVETTHTLLAGTVLSVGTSLGKFYGADWQQASFRIPDAFAGTSKRLVFTWINNSSGGNTPPVAIDNVEINRIRPAALTSETELVSFTGKAAKWSATAPEWITLSAANGTMENETGQFTYTCQENNAPYLREGMITLKTGNDKLYVKVVQAGKNPSGLTAGYNAETQSVVLEWAPVSSPTIIEKTPLRWDTGIYSSAVSVTGETVEAATRFAPEDLSNYAGAKIRAVNLLPRMIGSNMELVIRQDRQIVYTQALKGLIPGVFNKIELPASVAIDATKELIAGYAYMQRPGTSGNYVIAGDAGPAKTDKGNLVSTDNGISYRPSTSSRNWNIALDISSDPAVTYTVLRNGTPIASSLQDTRLEDTDPPLDSEVVYTLSAVYNNDAALQSPGVETKVFTGLTGIKNIAGGLFDFSWQDAVLHLHNRTDDTATISLYNLSGQLLRTASLKQGETQVIPGLSRGVYIVRASYQAYGDVIKKIIK
ncbi:MAG: M6 family metalloprotease domain-containing protein [Candidatus Symbiothrix sp.]|jgi:M6 family metalloprotease-like protein|nr:M6 family metalloprotease domain-containing protein [Candidatus Symbiothrix sp.]